MVPRLSWSSTFLLRQPRGMSYACGGSFCWGELSISDGNRAMKLEQLSDPFLSVVMGRYIVEL